jgi:Zn-dependent protease
LHATFLLLLAWIASVDRKALPLFVGLFICILLHELGHALTAIRLGYPIRRITMYPIGGVATLEAQPSPKHEFLITIAGPLVNVVIAGVIYLALRVTPGGLPVVFFDGIRSYVQNPDTVRSYFTMLGLANASLAVFNLLPAFPMDGGRIVRSLLAMRIGQVAATRIAGRVGQVLAVAAGFYGFFSGNITLLIIAGFVFMGAGQEISASQSTDPLAGVRMQDIMVENPETILPGRTLAEVGERLLHTHQHDFPVVLGSDYIGLLTRDRLIQGIAQHGRDAYASSVLDRDAPTAGPDDALLGHLQSYGQDAFPIVILDGDQRVLGIVTRDNLMEYMLLRRMA